MNDKIFNIMVDTLSKKGGVMPWEGLVIDIKAKGIKVSNWLSVRGVLQWGIDEGYIVRTSSLIDENYIRGPKFQQLIEGV